MLTLLLTAALSAPTTLIAGDSISIGYTPYVADALAGEWDVERLVFEENGTVINWQSTTYQIASVLPRLEGRRWDVIHWNTGTWDVTYHRNIPVEVYADNLHTIAQALRGHCDVLIFATTTPVIETTSSQITGRTNARIEEYNAVALAVMASEGAQVNDLYGVAEGLPGDAYSDGLHFTALGSSVLGAAVVDAVRATQPPRMDAAGVVATLAAALGCITIAADRIRRRAGTHRTS